MPTLIVGDTHGDTVCFRALLAREGAIDAADRRQPGWRIVQLGDLIHGGRLGDGGDLTCLDLAFRAGVEVLVGNHDAVHAYPGAGFPPFAGQTPTGELREMAIERLRHAGGYRDAATVVAGHLVTHAGLHPAVRAACHLHAFTEPQDLADAINIRFRARVAPGAGRDPLFDWVGARRDGPEPHGGVLWGDWHDLVEVARGAHDIGQVVGHTPVDGGVQARGCLWNVDLGAALSGFLGGLVVDDGGDTWRPIWAHRQG